MIFDYIKALPQYLLPQHLLSKGMHYITRIENTTFKNALIKAFIHKYKVNMEIALEPEPTAYAHFNKFFTRSLNANARPISTKINTIISPVDGAVSQYGDIIDGRIFQAKNRLFSVEELLGGSSKRAAPFHGGQFITIYLSPKDYHRIHCPLNAELIEATHIPGQLFSVNPATTRVIPKLFARNERLAAIFQTEIGKIAIVMVGAIFVSSIETTWGGVINTSRQQQVQTWFYGTESDKEYQVNRGGEIGRFNMGSTVILLFEANSIAWNLTMKLGLSLKMGEQIASIIHPKHIDP